jgi:hypothetical protein
LGIPEGLSDFEVMSAIRDHLYSRSSPRGTSLRFGLLKIGDGDFIIRVHGKH